MERTAAERCAVIMRSVGLVGCLTGWAALAAGDPAAPAAAAAEGIVDPAAAAPVQMGEMVVTAARTERAAVTTPANVTVITAADIAASSAQTVPDVLKYCAAVGVADWTGTGRTAVVDARGFGETAPANVLVLVDGRQLNAPDMSGVDWTTIPLERIDRIEVVRGGNSVLYGDHAVGAVINIRTRKSAVRPVLSAETVVASDRTVRQSLGLAGAEGPLYYALNGSYADTDGYRHNSYFRNRTAGLTLGYDADTWFNLELSAGTKSDRYGMPGAIRDNRDRTEAANPRDYAETETSYLHLTPRLRLDDLGELSVALGYSERATESRWFGMWGNTVSRWRILDWTVGPKYTLDRPLFGHDNVLVAGIDFRSSDLHDITFGRGDMHRHEAGYYVNDTFSLVNERLFLDAGYRFTRIHYDYAGYVDSLGMPQDFADMTHNVDAARAALTWVYAPGSKLFVAFDRSFRTQMLEELGGAGFNMPLDEVQIAHQYQAGFRHTLNPRLAFGATVFQIDTRDEIFYDPWNGYGINTAYDRTRRRGLELSADAQPLDEVKLFASYTYLEAELQGGAYDENEIPGVARHSGSLGAAWSPVEQVTLDVRARWLADKELISDWRNEAGGWDGRNYFVTDMRLSYRPWKQLELYVGVNNVLNTEYAEYGVWALDWSTWPAGGPFAYGYPAPERTFIAGLRVTHEF